MIQKYLKVQASKSDLFQELLGFEAWPQWWPGVQSVNVIKKEPTLCVVDLTLNMTMTLNMTLELNWSQEDAIKFRQLKGWFKSYKGNWIFLPAPDGNRTSLKITTEVECGMLIPKGMVYTRLSESLDLFGEALNKRLQGKKRGAAQKEEALESTAQKLPLQVGSEPASPGMNARKLVHVFQTKKGLEVWISGRRYLMKSACSERRAELAPGLAPGRRVAT
jgi:ribosome-associated toxin RatA of RatAB toxin-antitoxin module